MKKIIDAEALKHTIRETCSRVPIRWIVDDVLACIDSMPDVRGDCCGQRDPAAVSEENDGQKGAAGK